MCIGGRAILYMPRIYVKVIPDEISDPGYDAKIFHRDMRIDFPIEVPQRPNIHFMKPRNIASMCEASCDVANRQHDRSTPYSRVPIVRWLDLTCRDISAVDHAPYPTCFAVLTSADARPELTLFSDRRLRQH